MFQEFLQYLASQMAYRTPAKSKKTPDPKVFTGVANTTEDVHNALKAFAVALELKMTLNLDCYPTTDARIAYVFSRTSGLAQGHIVSKIQNK